MNKFISAWKTINLAKIKKLSYQLIWIGQTSQIVGMPSRVWITKMPLEIDNKINF